MSVIHGATHFFLMRHAATVWNREGRIQGQADSPLAPEGRRQLETWCRHLDALKFDAIWSSDLGRARATARALNRKRDLPLSIEPRLRELDWGHWTGRIHRHLKQDNAAEYARQTAQGWQFRPPAGESYLEVLERALVALSDTAVVQRGRRILVVTHEGVLKCLIYHLAIRDGCGQKPERMAAGHLHHVVHGDQGLVLRRMNAITLNH